MSFLLSKVSGTINIPLEPNRKEQNLKEVSNKSSADLKNGLLLPKHEQQQARKESSKPGKCSQMCGLDIKNPYYFDEDIWDEAPVDELVSKLITKIRLLPEAVIERDSKESSKVDDVDSLITNSGITQTSTEAIHSNPKVLSLSDGSRQEKMLQALPHAHFEARNENSAVKLKSALRGGYENSGMGARPKLHVTWAPSVYDPLCTSSSHTMPQDSRKHRHPKKDRRNHKSKDSSHKGKGNGHGDSYKKYQKKLTRKLRQESLAVSGQTIAAQNMRLSSNYMLRSAPNAESGESSADSARINSFMLSQKAYSVSHLLTLDTSIPYSWQSPTRKLFL